MFSTSIRFCYVVAWVSRFKVMFWVVLVPIYSNSSAITKLGSNINVRTNITKLGSNINVRTKTNV
jgi:hypothetical protein